MTRGAETQKLAPKGLSAIANNNPILTEWFQVGKIRINQMRTHLTLSEGSEYPIHQKYEVPSLTRARSKGLSAKAMYPILTAIRNQWGAKIHSAILTNKTGDAVWAQNCIQSVTNQLELRGRSAMFKAPPPR